jgi:hypothetical protein
MVFQAIKGMSSIILDYDHDKKVGAMGFGAIEPGKDEASHCFPLKLDASPGEIEVDGMQGLLEV